MAEHVQVGAFKFDQDFIYQYLIDDVIMLKDLNHFKHEHHGLLSRDSLFTDQLPLRNWHISRADPSVIENMPNPEIDSMGDVRFRFYSHRAASLIQEKEEAKDYRCLVSVLGRQRGGTIEYRPAKDKDVSNIWVGKDVSLKEMLMDEGSEKKKIRENMKKLRYLLGICLFIFIYGVLSNEYPNFLFEVPQLGLFYDQGWLLPSIALALLAVSLTALMISKFVLILF